MGSSKSVKLKKGYDKRKKVGLPRKLDDIKRTLEWDRSGDQAHKDMPSQIKHGIDKTTDDKEYDTKHSMICKICFNADFNTVFLDCGHSVACTVCAEKVPCCPICRKDIKRVIRIFTS